MRERGWISILQEIVYAMNDVHECKAQVKIGKFISQENEDIY